MIRSALVLVMVLVASAAVAQQIPVVASFSIIADMVRNVGGERVSVQALVGPGNDAHVFQPKPADARTVAAARLVVVNGLGLEGWLNRLVSASGYKGPVAVLSAGIEPLTMDADAHDHDGGRAQRHRVKPRVVADPHAWQSLENGRIYVANIVKALETADPAGSAVYRANGEAYARRLTDLDRAIRAEIAAVPPAKRKVITSHDAFQYFARDYGIAMSAPVGISTDSEPSAADVARLVRQIRAEGIKAVFVENMTDPRLVDQLAREAGAVVGGTLYSDALSPPGSAGDSYEKMFKHNATALKAGMLKN